MQDDLHLIRSFLYQVRYADRYADLDGARQISERLMEILESDLQDIMQEVFDRMVPADQALQLDTLVLDLQALDGDSLEVMLPYRFKEALEEAIRMELNRLGTSRRLSSTPEQSSPIAYKALRLIEYFLNYSILPWWSKHLDDSWKTSSGGISIPEIWEQLIGKDRQALRQVVRHVSSIKAQERLLEQIPYASLLRLWLDSPRQIIRRLDHVVSWVHARLKSQGAWISPEQIRKSVRRVYWYDILEQEKSQPSGQTSRTQLPPAFLATFLKEFFQEFSLVQTSQKYRIWNELRLPPHSGTSSELRALPSIQESSPRQVKEIAHQEVQKMSPKFWQSPQDQEAWMQNARVASREDYQSFLQDLYPEIRTDLQVWEDVLTQLYPQARPIIREIQLHLLWEHRDRKLNFPALVRGSVLSLLRRDLPEENLHYLPLQILESFREKALPILQALVPELNQDQITSLQAYLRQNLGRPLIFPEELLPSPETEEVDTAKPSPRLDSDKAVEEADELPDSDTRSPESSPPIETESEEGSATSQETASPSSREALEDTDESKTDSPKPKLDITGETPQEPSREAKDTPPPLGAKDLPGLPNEEDLPDEVQDAQKRAKEKLAQVLQKARTLWQEKLQSLDALSIRWLRAENWAEVQESFSLKTILEAIYPIYADLILEWVAFWQEFQEDSPAVETRVGELLWTQKGEAAFKLIRFYEESLQIELALIPKEQQALIRRQLLEAKPEIYRRLLSQKETNLRYTPWEALRYFFTKGVLPWSEMVKPAARRPRFMQQFLQRLLGESPAFFAEILREVQPEIPLDIRLKEILDSTLAEQILEMRQTDEKAPPIPTGPMKFRESPEDSIFYLDYYLTHKALPAYLGIRPKKEVRDFIQRVLQTLIREHATLWTLYVDTLPEPYLEQLEKLVPQSIKNFRERKSQEQKMKDLEKIMQMPSEAALPLDEPLFIQNAGLSLLHPFLPRLFQMLGYTNPLGFTSIEMAHRAVHALHYLVFGLENPEETELVFNKILCGLPWQDPLPLDIRLSEEEKETCISLLEGTINNWPLLKNSSPDNLRGTFLIREGRIQDTEEAWELRVEPRGFDVMLKHLPWGISLIHYPWLEKVITVQWGEDT